MGCNRVVLLGPVHAANICLSISVSDLNQAWHDLNQEVFFYLFYLILFLLMSHVNGPRNTEKYFKSPIRG